MISGLFIALGARRFGVRRFRNELVNVAGNDVNLGRGYDWVLAYLVPVEFAVMFTWWIYQAVAVIDPEGWCLHHLGRFRNAVDRLLEQTCLMRRVPNLQRPADFFLELFQHILVVHPEDVREVNGQFVNTLFHPGAAAYQTGFLRQGA